MPVNVVKAPRDEKLWAKAKAIVAKQYPDLSEENDRHWRLVVGIYRKLKRGKPGASQRPASKASKPWSSQRPVRKGLVWGWLVKSHVQGYWRRSPGGKKVWVGPHEDKRSRRAEQVGQTTLSFQEAVKPSPAVPPARPFDPSRIEEWGRVTGASLRDLVDLVKVARGRGKGGFENFQTALGSVLTNPDPGSSLGRAVIALREKGAQVGGKAALEAFYEAARVGQEETKSAPPKPKATGPPVAGQQVPPAIAKVRASIQDYLKEIGKKGPNEDYRKQVIAAAEKALVGLPPEDVARYREEFEAALRHEFGSVPDWDNPQSIIEYGKKNFPRYFLNSVQMMISPGTVQPEVFQQKQQGLYLEIKELQATIQEIQEKMFPQGKKALGGIIHGLKEKETYLKGVLRYAQRHPQSKPAPEGIYKASPLWGWLIKSAPSHEAWRTEPRDEAGRWVITGGSGRGPFSTQRGELTSEEQARVKALKLAPALTEVRVNPNPQADLLAIAKAPTGKTVYVYSGEYKDRQKAAKFARMKQFGKALPTMRKKLFEDAINGDPAKGREEAQVAFLIDRTGFRVGADKETHAKVKAYGASSLEVRHVKIEEKRVHFDFVAKKGVACSKTVEDPELARLLKFKIDSKPPNERLFSVNEDRVNAYLKSFGSFTAKDFRTFHASSLARSLVKSMPTPASEAAFRKQRLAVARQVSEHLGNTPKVALADYIDPAVFHPWEAALMKGAKLAKAHVKAHWRTLSSGKQIWVEAHEDKRIKSQAETLATQAAVSALPDKSSIKQRGWGDIGARRASRAINMGVGGTSVKTYLPDVGTVSATQKLRGLGKSLHAFMSNLMTLWNDPRAIVFHSDANPEDRINWGKEAEEAPGACAAHAWSCVIHTSPQTTSRLMALSQILEERKHSLDPSNPKKFDNPQEINKLIRLMEKAMPALQVMIHEQIHCGVKMDRDTFLNTSWGRFWEEASTEMSTLHLARPVMQALGFHPAYVDHWGMRMQEKPAYPQLCAALGEVLKRTGRGDPQAQAFDLRKHVDPEKWISHVAEQIAQRHGLRKEQIREIHQSLERFDPSSAVTTRKSLKNLDAIIEGNRAKATMKKALVDDEGNHP